jgi:trypsin-like peptidase
MTPEYKYAIARIVVGGARGTAFLVSDDGLVLTALHVIGPLAEPFVPYRGSITLEFGDKAVHATWTAAAKLVQHSVQDDWALLQLVDPVPPYPARPLPLAGIRFDPDPASWETWGFPTVAALEGTGYDGSSVIQADVFEVSCAALHQSMVDGISGAPLVVGGDVCGIVQQAFMSLDAENRPRVEDSKLKARTLRCVMSAVGGRLQWDDYAELPFEPHVKEAVTGLFKDPARLRELGKNVGVNVSVTRRELLPGKIARRALRTGLDHTYVALSSTPGPLDAKEGVRILEYVAAGGLGDAPVREVRAGLRGENAELAVLLCARQDLTARFFVWRARYGVTELGAFEKRVFTIGPCPDEGEVAYFHAELRKELARITRRQGAALDQWIKDGRELFFALVPGMVRQEVFEKVAPDFPGGRFVQFAPEPPLKAQPRIRAVVPELTAAEEQAINDRCTYAEADLAGGG